MTIAFGTETLTLKTATGADKEFARTVHHRAYRDVVVRQFGEWNNEEQDMYFESTWSKYDSQIILLNQQPVGYWSVEYSPLEIHLHQFLLLPEYQGKRIGSHLLRWLISQSVSRNIPIRLRVFRESDAYRLYAKMGFMATSTSEEHIVMEFVPTQLKIP